MHKQKKCNLFKKIQQLPQMCGTYQLMRKIEMKIQAELEEKYQSKLVNFEWFFSFCMTEKTREMIEKTTKWISRLLVFHFKIVLRLLVTACCIPTLKTSLHSSLNLSRNSDNFHSPSFVFLNKHSCSSNSRDLTFYFFVCLFAFHRWFSRKVMDFFANFIQTTLSFMSQICWIKNLSLIFNISHFPPYSDPCL